MGQTQIWGGRCWSQWSLTAYCSSNEGLIQHVIHYENCLVISKTQIQIWWQDRVVNYMLMNWKRSMSLWGYLPGAPLTMMTSSNGNIFRVTGPLCGEFTGPGEFPTQRPVTRSFDVFFDLRLNKRLSKQPWGWWFETPSWSLWRQCNELT